jgi:hypothetical protein
MFSLGSSGASIDKLLPTMERAAEIIRAFANGSRALILERRIWSGN